MGAVSGLSAPLHAQEVTRFSRYTHTAPQPRTVGTTRPFGHAPLPLPFAGMISPSALAEYPRPPHFSGRAAPRPKWGMGGFGSSDYTLADALRVPCGWLCVVLKVHTPSPRGRGEEVGNTLPWSIISQGNTHFKPLFHFRHSAQFHRLFLCILHISRF